MFGHVWLEIEPNPGGGVEFADEGRRRLGAARVLPGRREGRPRGAAEKASIAGYPLSDFKATLYDGSFHTVDSNELSFKIAASLAPARRASRTAAPVLLEPIMDVEVRVPEEYMGDVNRDLNTRRGRVLGMDTPATGMQVVSGPRAAGRAVHLRDRAALADPRPRHVHRDAGSLRGSARARRPEGDRGAQEGGRDGRQPLRLASGRLRDGRHR